MDILFTSRHQISLLMKLISSPCPRIRIESRCSRQLRVPCLFVAGTCFTRTFPQLRSAPSSCQPRETDDVLCKNKDKLFRFAPPSTPEIPLQECFKQLPTLWPEGLWLPGELHLVQSEAPSSWLVQAVCPPFSYYFRFLLQFSALRKFTPTGACYARLLTTSNFVSCIMKNAGEIEVFFFLSLLGAIRSSGYAYFLFTQTLSFRPFQQSKTHHQLTV